MSQLLYILICGSILFALDDNGLILFIYQKYIKPCFVFEYALSDF